MRTVLAAVLLAASLSASAADFLFDSATISKGGVLSTDHVFNGFGCAGKNLSPALNWSGAPPETQSYAITVYDPDAPTGSGWWHWLVYDIPAEITSLPQGVGSSAAPVPEGVKQGRTDFGTTGFGGACPPVGDKPHRYVFTIYALKVPTLGAPADATAAMIGFSIHANKIAEAHFIATYSR